jgi:putative flippase GtrA
MKTALEIPRTARHRNWLVRVAMVALIGLPLSWVTYEIIFFFNPLDHKATSSWFLSYLIGIFRQHHLHRCFSFPDTGLAYNASLLRDATSSVTLLILGSVLNWILVEAFALNHRLAWLVCTATIAAATVILLKKFVFKSNRDPADPRRHDQ